MFFVTIKSGKFFKTIDDNLPCDTILNLKESINLRHGIPIHLQRLLYKGVLLNDIKKISEYEIQSYDVVDLDLHLLEINFLKNDTYNLKWYVENGVTIAELQKRIFHMHYGIIIEKDSNYVLKDGDTIIIVYNIIPPF